MAARFPSQIESVSPATRLTPLERDLLTVPNLLSLSRIVLILVSPVFYVVGMARVGLALGVLAGISDYLDGYLARRLGQTTELGAILDRLSDLVFETTGFVLAVYFHLLSPFTLVAYMLRETLVLSARQYVAERRELAAIRSSFVGKLKTNFFGWAFLLIFAHHAGILADVLPSRMLFYVGLFGISGGLVFSYVSGFQYLRGFARIYNRPAR
jgi:CDP-diacylglycerol--glycerol-3-phosphate 3-phosphatidyltransferase